MSRETADEAVDHYSRKRDHSLTERGNSEIMGVRKFHNWIKRTLIREYCPYGGDMVTVLDICGGKGGDFHKWAEEANVGHVVLIDAARGSIDDALERYREFHWNKNQWHFGVTFVCADCFGADLHAILPPHLSFDFASCQFALQYAFSSEERIRGLLRNVSIRLKPGCSFIGTIPDAEFLIKKLKESPSPSFGNDLYHVTFPAKIDGRFADFGSSYRFYLREAVDDVLEYLVRFSVLEKLAADYGFLLLAKRNFLGICKNYDPRQFNRMTPAELEVAEIYLMFAFVKERAVGWPPAHPKTTKDVIVA